MTTLRARLSGLLAVVALLAIVAGLPLVLLAVGATPIPQSMPSLETIKSALSSPDDGTLAVGFIKFAAWTAWVFLTLSIAAELISRVRGVRVPPMPGLKLPQSAAHALVSTAMLLFIAVPMSAQGAPVAAAAPHPTAMALALISTPAPVGGQDQTTSTLRTERSTRASVAAKSTHKKEALPATLEDTVQRGEEHTVQPGETLWSIASDHLGSGDKYPEIVALNTEVLGDRPGFLKPGWVLSLPLLRQQSQDGEHTVTVRSGDTISEIAQEELGDPSRYREIFEASQDTTQPGGAKLSDPDMISEGWSLTIPDTTSSTKPSDPKPGKADPVPGQSGSAAKDPGVPSPHTGAPSPALAKPAPTNRPLAPVESSTVYPFAGQQPSSAAAASVEDTPNAPWMLEGLAGAGTVLAGSMLLLLRRRRRAQFRARRPGRTISVPEPVLAPVEKTLTVSGSRSAPTVELMDDLPRRLASRLGAVSQNMPNVAAVELATGGIVLHLSQAQELPAPWLGSQDWMRWKCPTGVDVEAVGPQEPDQLAPYPLLVTIGACDDNNVWLLNCEDLAAITITGDPTYGRDFARYLAASWPATLGRVW